jgi:GDPmannose 4,6-dehydratase
MLLMIISSLFRFCSNSTPLIAISNIVRQGYEVHGIKRHASTFNQSRIEHLFMHGLDQQIHTGKGDAAAPLKLHMHYGDVLDINSLVSVFIKVRPDEIYNLAAQSHVRTSFDMPVYVSLLTLHQSRSNLSSQLHCAV